MPKELRAMAEQQPVEDTFDWGYEDVCDSSCGWPCTENGCHESHPSGIFRIEGPDWNHDDLEVYGVTTRNKIHAGLIAAAPKLLAALEKFVSVNANSGYEFECNEPDLYKCMVDAIGLTKVYKE